MGCGKTSPNNKSTMSSPNPSLEFDALCYEPLSDRPSKVRLSNLGRPLNGSDSLEDFLDSLPTVLATESLKQLQEAIGTAHLRGRHVLAALGGHVIKTGCGPYLNDWITRGVLTGVAMNGSAAIHDLELAVAGHTSEDVGPRLLSGKFGLRRRPQNYLPQPAIRQLAKVSVWVPLWAR